MERLPHVPTLLAEMLAESVDVFLRISPGPVDIADFHDALLTLDEAVGAALADVRRDAVRVVNQAVVGRTA